MSATRIDVIFNPGAGGAGGVVAWQRHMRPGREIRLLSPSEPGDLSRLAYRSATGGADLVIAAGGDGTVTQVVDGLMAAEHRPPLGVLPLGTGNDLARTLDIPLDPDEALEVLLAGRQSRIDVIAVSNHEGPTTHAVNVAAGGFSGEVDEVLSSASKARWGPLAYVWSALKVAPDMPRYTTTFVWDGGPERETFEVLNVVIANGRTVGGGRAVAPRANPEDGLMDVVVVRFGSTLDLAAVGARLLAGDYMASDLVTCRRAREVEISAQPAMPFNVDGELVDRASFRFVMVPRALPVIVGPAYRPDPTDGSPVDA